MGTQDHPYLLHTNYRSTCSARLRIALNLKNIPYEAVHVDLSKDENKTEAYTSLNPANTVPCLQNHDRTILITQSLAALEYLEEHEKDQGPSLLPPPRDAFGRAQVRALAYMIACDIQPLTSSRVLKRVEALGGPDWSREIMEHGLRAYERVVGDVAGIYSYGDAITLADVCLAPAVWKAVMCGVDVQGLFPYIWRIYLELSTVDAIVKAHPYNQPDCPAHLRGAVE